MFVSEIEPKIVPSTLFRSLLLDTVCFSGEPVFFCEEDNIFFSSPFGISILFLTISIERICAMDRISPLTPEDSGREKIEPRGERARTFSISKSNIKLDVLSPVSAAGSALIETENSLIGLSTSNDVVDIGTRDVSIFARASIDEKSLTLLLLTLPADTKTSEECDLTLTCPL